jgi:quinol monooxygenase YgiN
VTWTIECTINPDDLPQVQQLAEDLSHLCLHEEPDTHGYEWSVDPSGSIVHIFERYADSAAAMLHIRLFEERFAERFRALLKPERVVLIGSPSDELITSLAALSPLVLQPLVGFHR